jgi:CBS domain-containing protein
MPYLRRPTRKHAVSPTRSPAETPPALLPYNVPVSDVLSAPAILIGTEASLFDAMVLMRTHGVTGLPVIDVSGSVVGVISQKDLARLVAGFSAFPAIGGVLDILMAGLGEQPNVTMRRLRGLLERTRVREVMTSPAFVIRPSATLEFAAQVMRDNEINRLPVVEDDRLVGVITRNDLVRALVPPAVSA